MPRVTCDQVSVVGASRGGVGTWFRIRPSGVAFDVGLGSPELEGADYLFLTHGHLDHVSGLPFVLSQRQLSGMRTTSVFCPAGLEAPLREFIAAAAKVEGRRYDYSLRGLEAGDRIDVGGGLTVEAFETPHGVESLGYCLLQPVTHLRGEFVGMAPGEIVRLKAQGTGVEVTEERCLVAYVGDSGPGILDSEPRILTSTIALLECTFIHPRWKEHARLFDHIHVDDLKLRADSFANERIVLHHLSRRFSLSELRDIVDRELPQLSARVRIIGEASEAVE